MLTSVCDHSRSVKAANAMSEPIVTTSVLSPRQVLSQSESRRTDLTAMGLTRQVGYRTRSPTSVSCIIRRAESLARRLHQGEGTAQMIARVIGPFVV